MDDILPTEIKCPVCLEIPSKEIFQCKNGHTVCHSCLKEIKQCPQCRVFYDKDKIRNRALESLLDTMTFDCQYKALGCTAKLARGKTLHLENCQFSGTPLKICELLGYQCGFIVTTETISEFLAHFETSHNILVRSQNALKIRLEGILNISSHQKSMWTPVIIIADTKARMPLLLLSRYNEKDQTIYFVCFGMGQESDFSLNGNFKVKAVHKSETPDIVWQTPALPIKTMRAVLKDPLFRFPYDLLVDKYTKDGVLTVYFSVSNIDKDDNSVENNDTVSVINTPIGTQTHGPSPGPLPDMPQASSSYRAPLSLVDVPDFSQFANFYSRHCKTCDKVIYQETYKCLQCRSFDICGNCMNRENHVHRIFVRLQNEAQKLTLITLYHGIETLFPGELNEEGPYPDWISKKGLACCNCVRNIKYLCLRCRPSRGYCEKCFKKYSKGHRNDHMFAVVNTRIKLLKALKNIPEDF